MIKGRTYRDYVVDSDIFSLKTGEADRNLW